MINDIFQNLDNSYQDLELSPEFKENLNKTVLKAYAERTVFPSIENLFKALNLTPLNKVKVVILGQDPYQTKGFASGLAFGVNPGVKIPKSLKNILIELNNDLNLSIDTSIGHSLKGWAEQGVLLLNTILTVEEGISLSHKDFKWQDFTDAIIKKINGLNHKVVFILWGKNAQEKEKIIASKNIIIKSAHPSPLSAHNGFFGSHPFSKTNKIFLENKLTPIDWSKID